MFSVGGFLRYSLSRLWPALLVAAVAILFMPDRIVAVVGLALLIAFAVTQHVYRYGKAFDKHTELQTRFGDAYAQKLKLYLDQSGVEGYIDFGWVVIEHELKKAGPTE